LCCAAVSNHPRIAEYHQNARLDQEEQLTSIKRPRSHVIMKNKTKYKQFTVRRRGIKMATQAIPLHPLVATLGPEPADLGGKLAVGKFWQILVTFGDFSKNSHFWL
jgi:hypothetical protein